MYQTLSMQVHRPLVHWIDNEAPDILLQFNQSQKVSYQLTPPHVH